MGAEVGAAAEVVGAEAKVGAVAGGAVLARAD